MNKDLRLSIIKATVALVETKKELAEANARIAELEVEQRRVQAVILDTLDPKGLWL